MTDFPIVEEPLEESAPIAWEQAPKLCRRDPASGESCAWFHGLWQILRLIGLNTTPEHHAAFFRAALHAFPHRSGRPAVLISGTADYSLLARLLPALRASGRNPDVTVLDRCETPLMLNQWYARRAGYAIQTACCDILEYDGADRYDMVLTHSFIGQFEPARRPALMAKWHRLLRTDGIVATVNRLRPGAAADRTGFSPHQAAALVETVRRESKRLPGALAAKREELASMASQYAGRMGAWPIQSEAELRDIFEHGGFAVEQMEVAPVDLGSSLSGPTAPAGAPYASVIARRR